jgi:hypothetical protein
MEPTKGEKLFKKLAITAIIIATIIWFYNFNETNKNLRAKYKNSSFNGIIKDTVHYPLQHDLPTYIFTNDSSYLLDINEGYMTGRAKVGDSLSKVSGNDTVYVFRKQDSGQYIQIFPLR